MFDSLIERVALALDQNGLPYMIIGGQAVLLYGEPRLTRDIDIALGVGLDGLPRVLSATRDAGLEVLVDPETFTRKTLVLPCRDPQTTIRVDLILSFSPYEREAIKRARRVRFGATDVSFASVEDLVIAKIVAGRPRDLEDVRSVLLKNPQIDDAWVRRWLTEFERALDEKFIEKLEQAREGAR